MVELQLAVLVLALCGPAPRTAPSRVDGFRYAEGTPKQPALTLSAQRLRSALFRPQGALPAEDAAASVAMEPAELSDLLDKLLRKRLPIATRLALGYARAGTVPRSGTFSTLISRCRQAGEHDECVALVDTLHSVGLRGNPNMYLSLIATLAKADRHEQLLHVYGGMRRMGVRQSNQTHTVVLASLLRAERVAEAADVARELRSESMRDDYRTFDVGLRNVILQALLRHGDVDEVRWQSRAVCRVGRESLVRGRAPGG